LSGEGVGSLSIVIEPLKHYGRGFLMGCADIVPGVSGGTIALILGIYRAFIGNLRKGASTLKAWLKGDLTGGWNIFTSIDWLFIVPLGAGAVTAFALLRHPMKDLLAERPEGVAAVFTGLVIASCVIVWQGITTRDPQRLGIIAGVAVLTFWLLGYQSGAVSDPSLIAFFATGAIAICAMILPGISGSFIMLMLGMYAAVLGGEISQLAVFGVGAIFGLAIFSSLLNWVLENYEQTLMAALLGLMIGSMRVLWPWPNGVGEIGDTAEENVKGTDLAWPEMGQLAGGIGLAVAAAAVTLLIVRFAEAKPADEKVDVSV